MALVIECHMNRTNEIIAILLEDFRGWVSPSGGRVETGSGEDHGKHADRLLTRQYPGWKWDRSKRFTRGGVSYASDALEYKGWIRVVGDGIYTVYKITPEIAEQLVGLISDIDDSTPVIIGVSRGRGLRQTSKEEALRWLSALNEQRDSYAGQYKSLYGGPKSANYLPLGTISHGTMREEDLIPAFLDALESVDPGKAQQFQDEYAKLGGGDEEQREEFLSDFCWETLSNALDEHTPPFTYFGANEGDGSDYGVWISCEAIKDALADEVEGGLKAVDRGEPLPFGCKYVIVMNRAGDYGALLNGGTGEVIWSI